MDTSVATATEEQELTAADRCDSCSAAAQVRARFLTGMLLFCGHHARKNKDGLASQALSVYDPDGSLDL